MVAVQVLQRAKYWAIEPADVEDGRDQHEQHPNDRLGGGGGADGQAFQPYAGGVNGG